MEIGGLIVALYLIGYILTYIIYDWNMKNELISLFYQIRNYKHAIKDFDCENKQNALEVAEFLNPQLMALSDPQKVRDIHRDKQNIKIAKT